MPFAFANYGSLYSFESSARIGSVLPLRSLRLCVSFSASLLTHPCSCSGTGSPRLHRLTRSVLNQTDAALDISYLKASLFSQSPLRRQPFWSLRTSTQAVAETRRRFLEEHRDRVHAPIPFQNTISAAFEPVDEQRSILAISSISSVAPKHIT